MKKLILALLLGATPFYAQSPQIPITGTLGAGGQFPTICSSTITFPSDANYKPTYPATACSSGVMLIRGTLTAQRDLILPITQGYNWKVENLTSGGQNVRVIGTSGSGVVIPNGTAMVVLADGANYVAAGSSGGAGNPSGSSTWLQFNKAGSFGASANLAYDDSLQQFSLGWSLATPGYNVGGSSGDFNSSLLRHYYPTNYSQGIKSLYSLFNARCWGNGDCNIKDFYYSDNGESNDANGEGLVGARDYATLGEPTYVGVISGSANTNTQVTMSSYNGQGNFGNGRIAIQQEGSQTLTVSAATPHTLGSNSYVELTTNGTFTPSISGTLSNTFSVTHTSANTATAESLNLTGVTGAGCAVNDLITLLPLGGDGQIETARVTSASALSSGAQTVGVNLRNGFGAGSLIWCKGPQSEFADNPAIDMNGIKMLTTVLGATSSTNILVARQTGGAFDYGTVATSGSITLYSGARVIDSRNPSTNLPDALGFSVLADNNTTWTVGDHFEVADGNNQLFALRPMQLISNNPTARGSWTSYGCPSGSAGCGDLQTGVNRIVGNNWLNQNPATSYNTWGANNGKWDLMPLNYIAGPFGPVNLFYTAPIAPITEFTTTASSNFLLWGADDADFLENLSNSAGVTTDTKHADKFVFAGQHGATSNITPNLPSGTCTNGVSIDSTGKMVTTACGGGSGPTVQTNGTNNASQTALNFTSTSTVTFSNPSTGVESATVPNTTVNGVPCTPGSTCTIPVAVCAGPTTNCAVQQINPTTSGATTTVNSTMTTVQTTVPVASAAGLAAPLIVAVQNGALIEWIGCTAISSNTLTGCTRGYYGSAAQAWASGAVVAQMVLGYSTSATIAPYYYILQNGAIGYNGSNNAVPNTTAFNNSVAFYNQLTVGGSGAANGEVFSTNGAGTAAPVWTPNFSARNSNATAPGACGWADYNFTGLGVSDWDLFAANQDCTVGANGVGPNVIGFSYGHNLPAAIWWDTSGNFNAASVTLGGTVHKEVYGANAGGAVTGASSTAVTSTDSTGHLYLSENAGAPGHVCTATNGVCGAASTPNTTATCSSSQALTFATSGDTAFEVTLTAGCSLTLSDPGSTGTLRKLTLIIHPAGHQATLPASSSSLVWSGGSAPVPSTSADTVIVFASTGAGKIYGGL